MLYDTACHKSERGVIHVWHDSFMRDMSDSEVPHVHDMKYEIIYDIIWYHVREVPDVALT